jgi:hypothetical protein
MGTLDVEQLRIDLLRASKAAATDQHEMFLAAGTITLEYSLLGNLCDLLAAAVMVTHTIDRAHTEHRHADRGRTEVTDTFLGSTS